MDKWIDGIPSKPGIYWFDTGISMRSHEHFIFPLRVYKDGQITCAGHYASGPLDFFYNDSVNERIKKRGGRGARYMEVELYDPDGPWETDGFNIDHSYAWIKNRNGYIGFALIKSDYTGPELDVFYLNNPHSAESYGEWARKIDGYTFQKVKMSKELAKMLKRN